MNKYCSNCGTPAQSNASFCQKCGTKFTQSVQSNPASNFPPNQTHYPQGTIPPQHPPFQQAAPYPQQPGQTPFYIIQQISRKIKNASIFWLIFGIFSAIIGIIMISVGAVANTSVKYTYYRYYYNTDDGISTIVMGSLILITAIINIIYAFIHFGYAKSIITNPASILNKIQSPTVYIINIVINAVFGGLIGTIGGIMMLTTRSFIKDHQYLLQNNNTPQYGYTPAPSRQQPKPTMPNNSPNQNTQRQPPVSTAPQQNTQQSNQPTAVQKQLNIPEEPNTKQTPAQPEQESDTPTQAPIEPTNIAEESFSTSNNSETSNDTTEKY